MFLNEKNIVYDLNNDRFYCKNISEATKPITLCYNIGYKCNLKCDYCLSKNRKNPCTSFDLSNHLEFVKKWNPLRFVISGGEPFLYIEKMPVILQALKNNGMITFISSNGLLIIKEYLKIKGLVDWFDISLPALQRETYLKVRGKDCFDEVIKTIDFLIKQNERVRLTFTINQHNKNEMLQLPEFALKHGIHNIRLSHTYLYEEVTLKNNYWKDECKGIFKKYINHMKIYYPLSPEQLNLYRNSYLIMESDGCIYKGAINEDNYICHISNIDKYADIFSEISKLQLKLFCEEFYE